MILLIYSIKWSTHNRSAMTCYHWWTKGSQAAGDAKAYELMSYELMAYK